jgi:hypothetical protein
MQAHLIVVTPTKDSGGNITWKLCYNGTCGGPPDYVPIDLGKTDVPQTLVVSIDDPSNLGISFPAKVGDALWIQANSKPTGPGIGPVSQIVGATSSSKTLVFTDKNKNPPMTLKYQLNFVGPDNQKVTSIDPDIRNGGTTITVIGIAETTAFLIGAAVTLALAALWYRRVAAKRNLAS